MVRRQPGRARIDAAAPALAGGERLGGHRRERRRPARLGREGARRSGAPWRRASARQTAMRSTGASASKGSQAAPDLAMRDLRDQQLGAARASTGRPRRRGRRRAAASPRAMALARPRPAHKSGAGGAHPAPSAASMTAGGRGEPARSPGRSPREPRRGSGPDRPAARRKACAVSCASPRGAFLRSHRCARGRSARDHAALRRFGRHLGQTARSAAPLPAPDALGNRNTCRSPGPGSCRYRGDAGFREAAAALPSGSPNTSGG